MAHDWTTSLSTSASSLCIQVRKSWRSLYSSVCTKHRNMCITHHIILTLCTMDLQLYSTIKKKRDIPKLTVSAKTRANVMRMLGTLSSAKANKLGIYRSTNVADGIDLTKCLHNRIYLERQTAMIDQEREFATLISLQKTLCMYYLKWKINVLHTFVGEPTDHFGQILHGYVQKALG